MNNYTKPKRSFAQFDVFTYDSWSHLTGPDSRDSRRSAEHWGCSGLTCTGNVPDDTCSALEGKFEGGGERALRLLRGARVKSTRGDAHTTATYHSRAHLSCLRSRCRCRTPRSQGCTAHCRSGTHFQCKASALHASIRDTHTLSSVLKTFCIFLKAGSSE